MPDILPLIKSNPLMLIICIIAVVMLIIALIKRVLSLIVTAILVIIIYAGYLVYTGQQIPTNSDEIIEHLEKQVEDVKKNVTEKAIKEIQK